MSLNMSCRRGSRLCKSPTTYPCSPTLCLLRFQKPFRCTQQNRTPISSTGSSAKNTLRYPTLSYSTRVPHPVPGPPCIRAEWRGCSLVMRCHATPKEAAQEQRAGPPFPVTASLCHNTFGRSSKLSDLHLWPLTQSFP